MAGIALAEIYDADSPTSFAQLVNVSTLGFVGSGENVLTAGFVISGTTSKRLLIRAVGPGLISFGVGDILADPQVAVVEKPHHFSAVHLALERLGVVLVPHRMPRANLAT